MTIITETLHVETRGSNDMIDLTERLQLLLAKHKLREGHMTVFVPGSTAGLTTIEYEPGLRQDFSALMDRQRFQVVYPVLPMDLLGAYVLLPEVAR